MVIDYSPITRYVYQGCFEKPGGPKWNTDAVPNATIFARLHSTFVSVPSDFGGLSVDAYISGIIAGIIEGAGFPARVTAYSVQLEDGEVAPSNSATSNLSLPPRKKKAVFLVKFSASALARDS